MSGPLSRFINRDKPVQTKDDAAKTCPLPPQVSSSKSAFSVDVPPLPASQIAAQSLDRFNQEIETADANIRAASEELKYWARRKQDFIARLDKSEQASIIEQAEQIKKKRFGRAIIDETPQLDEME
jgi:hypothetical protein